MRPLSCLALSLLLFSCRDKPAPPPPPDLETVIIEDVPHVRQKPDFCGEACAEMWLSHLGSEIDQDEVFDRSGVDPARGRGAWTPDLKRALADIGFDVGPVWHPVRDDADLDRLFVEMHGDLEKGIPSIVCTYWSSTSSAEHFRLVLGYDAGTDEVVYHEPAEADGAYRHMSRSEFLAIWPLAGRDGRTAIRLALAQDGIDDPHPGQGRGRSEYAQHVIALSETLPPGFEVVVEPPFVVIGDGPADEVRRHARQTVRWSVTYLERDFFEKPPENIVDVWLFEDDASYRKHAASLFGDAPSTPYGYWSEEDDALVMNIATGGGTLVHEMVHAYMDGSFPDCPPWYDEGLGSLFEAPAERDGCIVGVVNWRLEGLLGDLDAGRVPAFEDIAAMDRATFYGDDSPTHYAAARYLLMWLQEKGLLRLYHHAFMGCATKDPTGWTTLLDILDVESETDFREDWERWVRELG